MPVDRSEVREDPLARGAQLVTATFCRDVIYDEGSGEVSLIKIAERVVVHKYVSRAEPRETTEALGLSLFVMMSNVPALWDTYEDQDDAEGEDDLSPPPEIAVGFKIYGPGGALSAEGVMLLHAIGRLGFASAQIGFQVPVSEPGILSADLSYLGNHLTTAMVEVVVSEVDLDSEGPEE